MECKSIMWECGSFTLSTIKEMSKDKWKKLVMATRSEKAKFLFTEEEFDAKLEKIWCDVNGVKESIKDNKEDTTSNTGDIEKGGRGKPNSTRGTK